MIDVMAKIHDLSAALDKETASLLPTSGKLLLLGSQDSVFLKAVHRKADAFGIECDHTFHFTPPYQGVIVDGETVPASFRLSADVDIDNSYSPGMSAVSQAVFDPAVCAGLGSRQGYYHRRPGSRRSELGKVSYPR